MEQRGMNRRRWRKFPEAFSEQEAEEKRL
jgi:hypothetical protein